MTSTVPVESALDAPSFFTTPVTLISDTPLSYFPCAGRNPSGSVPTVLNPAERENAPWIERNTVLPDFQ